MRTSLGVLGVAGVIAAVACGEAVPVNTSGAGGSGERYGNSECGECALDACGAALAECDADPGCAAYLACLKECPVAADGDADPECEAACPVAEGTTTAEAVARMRYCRESGDGGLLCPPCGKTQQTDPCLMQSCGPSEETNPCYKCDDENCCELFEAYLANPEAQALLLCLQACGNDDFCHFDCYDMHPDGVADVGARMSCLGILCGVECGSAGNPCNDCTKAKCPSQEIQCGKNADCFLIRVCEVECELLGGEPAACIETCLAQHPNGVDAFYSLVACVAEECLNVCSDF
jgi:hypothetical protein